MLRINLVTLEIIRLLQPLVREARRRESNVADQLDRCSTSMVANLFEGNAADGRMRRHKYVIALGEARETVAWLEIARAKGLSAPDLGGRLDHVIGVLVKLTR